MMIQKRDVQSNILNKTILYVKHSSNIKSIEIWNTFIFNSDFTNVVFQFHSFVKLSTKINAPIIFNSF